MRCLAGLESPQFGRVLLDGVPLFDNLRASYAKLGYLPDFFGLSEGLTVVQCFAYAAKARGVADAALASVITETARLLGLEDKLNREVGTLSRGQKQRVGIGQVIVHRPQFLLLDEPASGLDPEARHELSRLLLQLKANGMSILVSSHILSELDEYCTHMLIIKNGRIQAHQPLHQDNAPQQTVALSFVGGADETVLSAVRRLPQVLQAEAKDGGIWVELVQGDDVRAELLRALVVQGMPLSEVRHIKATLLESYQGSLKTNHAQTRGRE